MTAAEWLDPASLVTAIRGRGPLRRHQLRNFIIGGVRTSVRLDPVFWFGFDRICREEEIKPDRLVGLVHEACPTAGLTNTVRTFVMTFTMLHGPTGVAGFPDAPEEGGTIAGEADAPDIHFTADQEALLRVQWEERPRIAQALMVLMAQYPEPMAKAAE